MKIQSPSPHRGFTLIETVIAIGVLAVLLTGFMFVFAPAAAGIKKAIGVQEADRLASTLEQELVIFRKGNETGLPAKIPATSSYTGFDKAFEWIKKSSKDPKEALLIYQYRGSLSSVRPDGTPTPVVDAKNKQSGVDYTLLTMVRRNSDSYFSDKNSGDITAVEGGIYFVICKQLVFNSGELKPGTTPNQIVDPKNPTTISSTADTYPEAVIAFSVDFYSLRNKNPSSYSVDFEKTFTRAIANPPTVKPIFSRNLAVRR